ncbi:hypothetical protein G4B88_026081 [Cannabis sativa]|uniref:Pantoate--beta-alanine ligase n=2 Tax=Cannabis sativa TaxID=3483 RepID=A0A7J6DP03_CANSA|nr:hypothetical protein G4B88_026081 [Cannabis sativa]
MEVNNYLKMQKMMMMMSNNTNKKDDLYHVIHKVPSGDTPYVRAKHAQLVEKDPEGALVLFWEAINSGDRVDSALKDMAVVMKQLNRSEQAIQAKCGKVEEQIELLKRKLRLIYQGEVFHGKPTKTARSHGKKFQVSVKQETSRLLGNLGWAYMQKPNYMMAEVVYRKAQMIDPDSNKANNLGLCLMKQGRYSDANLVLQDILQGRLPGSEDSKTRKRAQEFKKSRYLMKPPHRILRIHFMISSNPQNSLNFKKWLQVENLEKGMCGESRPVFFRGVATIITKLFNIVEPDFAVFGKKDYQQWRLIQRIMSIYVRDLDFSIKVIGSEIVRDDDSLAMSSGNVHLSPEQRKQALSINKSLSRARIAAEKGHVNCQELRDMVIKAIHEAGGKVDYAEIVDQESSKAVEEITSPVVFCVATWFGKVRLIDNMEISIRNGDL